MFIKKTLTKYIVFVFFLSNAWMSFLIAMDTKEIAKVTMSYGGSGWVSGRAYILTGCCDQNQLNNIGPGDIIVTSTINRSWHQSLKNVAGIVTEQEGSNNYAAKLGKPVIVVPGATQKIMHGSFIGVDCTEKIVYEVFNSLYRCSINSQNVVGYFSSHSKFPHINWSTNESSASHVSRDKTVKSDKKERNINVVQTNKLYNDAITKEIICNDKSIIKEYVNNIKQEMEKARDYGMGWATGWAAWSIGLAITKYTFKTIPFVFVDQFNLENSVNEKQPEEIKKLIKEAFANLENEVDYIQETKERFKKEILKDQTKIDNDQIAEFLYKQVVANTNVSDDLRKELIEDPTKMNELVRNEVIDKAEYMNRTLLNLTVQYYLQDELRRKKQKI
jgi:phosphohistidine swiveling domain-containing protein